MRFDDEALRIAQFHQRLPLSHAGPFVGVDTAGDRWVVKAFWDDQDSKPVANEWISGNLIRWFGLNWPEVRLCTLDGSLERAATDGLDARLFTTHTVNPANRDGFKPWLERLNEFEASLFDELIEALPKSWEVDPAAVEMLRQIVVKRSPRILQILEARIRGAVYERESARRWAERDGRPIPADNPPFTW